MNNEDVNTTISVHTEEGSEALRALAGSYYSQCREALDRLDFANSWPVVDLDGTLTGETMDSDTPGDYTLVDVDANDDLICPGSGCEAAVLTAALVEWALDHLTELTDAERRFLEDQGELDRYEDEQWNGPEIEAYSIKNGGYLIKNPKGGWSELDEDADLTDVLDAAGVDYVNVHEALIAERHDNGNENHEALSTDVVSNIVRVSDGYETWYCTCDEWDKGVDWAMVNYYPPDADYYTAFCQSFDGDMDIRKVVTDETDVDALREAGWIDEAGAD